MVAQTHTKMKPLTPPKMAPERILRKIGPGIAKVYSLDHKLVRKERGGVLTLCRESRKRARHGSSGP